MKFEFHVIHSISRDQLRGLEHKLDQLFLLGESLMSKISEFATKQAEFNAQLDVAVVGIGEDVTFLKAKIEELQNTPGEITPEDQALLDELTAKSQELASKFTELDALTGSAPEVPTV